MTRTSRHIRLTGRLQCSPNCRATCTIRSIGRSPGFCTPTKAAILTACRRSLLRTPKCRQRHERRRKTPISRRFGRVPPTHDSRGPDDHENGAGARSSPAGGGPVMHNGVEFNRPNSPVTLAAVDIHRREHTPVRLYGKVPNAGPNWQHLRFHSEAEVVKHFTDGVLAGVNVGILLGDGLADVDLDCPEALRAADHVLTMTRRRSGRASAPGSHRWYRVFSGECYEKFTDTDRRTVLLELRADSGHQTVVPPSVHPETGETI